MNRIMFYEQDYVFVKLFMAQWLLYEPIGLTVKNTTGIVSS
jgi:hypothetical protein